MFRAESPTGRRTTSNVSPKPPSSASRRAPTRSRRRIRGLPPPSLHATAVGSDLIIRSGPAVCGWRRWPKRTTDATLDPYLAEHALLPLALADSPSEVKISRLTQRFLTQVWVIKAMTPARIVVRGIQDQAGVVSIAR
ncbi:MAG: hypothetical protein C4320_06250 [Armatimonadota bacterium]